jgi:16S rRNA (uracil1498-N3)-methyltransferase
VSHTFRYLIDHEPASGEHVALAPADAHHLTRVVRRRVGDAVEVIAPSGDTWPAVLIGVGEAAVLELGAAPRRAARRSPVWLCVGLCDWGRLDLVVEKCTELGVAGIAVFAGARSQRVPAAAAWERRRERLVRVARAAARQSGQGGLPEIDGVWTIDALCAALEGRRVIVLDPQAATSLAQALADGAPAAPIALVVGPDAGFAPAELAQLRAAGAEVCHLGDTTLRAETAAIVAAGITLALTGNLDREPGVVPTHGETNR